LIQPKFLFWLSIRENILKRSEKIKVNLTLAIYARFLDRFKLLENVRWLFPSTRGDLSFRFSNINVSIEMLLLRSRSPLRGRSQDNSDLKKLYNDLCPQAPIGKGGKKAKSSQIEKQAGFC
jgi:hypothetical protein